MYFGNFDDVPYNVYVQLSEATEKSEKHRPVKRFVLFLNKRPVSETPNGGRHCIELTRDYMEHKRILTKSSQNTFNRF